MIIRREIVERWLAAGSSPVDWCEENYAVSSSVAEFTNTVSNILFLAIPVICFGANVWSSYTKHVSPGALIQLCLLFVVGGCSAYFHATLSLFGQMLDEVAIIWSLCAAYASFTPDRMRPKFYRGIWAYIISTAAACAMTGAWFVAPYINSFVMMTFSVPIMILQYQEITIYQRKATYRLCVLALAMLILAISVWVADRAMCDIWRTMKIPGLHSLWHIFISLASYLSILVFSYTKALADSPLVKTSIRYLPGHDWGIPYVYCKQIAP